jgi:hypothetical protein
MFGVKAAGVKDSRGSHRQLFCMESPESCFEDFGEAALVSGKAQVKLDPQFASLVRITGYHVFEPLQRLQWTLRQQAQDQRVQRAPTGRPILAVLIGSWQSGLLSPEKRWLSMS